MLLRGEKYGSVALTFLTKKTAGNMRQLWNGGIVYQ